MQYNVCMQGWNGRTVFRKGLFAAVVAAGWGCDSETDSPVEGEDVPRGGLIGNGGGGSQIDWGCRMCDYKNSPTLGAFSVAEFTVSTPGLSGFSGFALRGIEDTNGDRHRVSIAASRIKAHTPKGVQQGTQIVGWSLIFQRPGGPELPLRIAAHEEHADWTSAQHPIDTYGLVHNFSANGEPTTADVSVCPDLDPESTTVVFTAGERYDDASKTVIPNQPKFVSVFCRAHVGAKLKFMGYDPSDGYNSTPETRQAGLKMLSADYCGTGKSFTKLGTPLDWQDAPLEHFDASMLTVGARLEARWDDAGALCLNAARAADLGEVLSTCEGHGVKLQPCEGDPVTLPEGTLWGSYLP